MEVCEQCILTVHQHTFIVKFPVMCSANIKIEYGMVHILRISLILKSIDINFSAQYVFQD